MIEIEKWSRSEFRLHGLNTKLFQIWQFSSFKFNNKFKYLPVVTFDEYSKIDTYQFESKMDRDYALLLMLVYAR